MLGQYLGRPPVWHTHWPRKQPDQKNVYGTIRADGRIVFSYYLFRQVTALFISRPDENIMSGRKAM
jgi:hypothetical protein